MTSSPMVGSHQFAGDEDDDDEDDDDDDDDDDKYAVLGPCLCT